MEEDIKILEELIEYWDKLLYDISLDNPIYKWIKDEKIIQKSKALQNLLARYKELEEIEKEHQKQIGELIIENNKLKEDLLGKSIQELGTSDFYMKEIEKHIPRIY